MNYKIYYYEDVELCILSNFCEDKPNINSIANDPLSLKISLSDKSVENIYSFFKENTIKQLLSDNPSLIEIDYSDIENLPFYSEDSFVKLVELIEESKQKCNNVISDFIDNGNDDSDEDISDLVEEEFNEEINETEEIFEEEPVLVGSVAD